MKDELGGDYEKTVVALMTEPITYIATQINDAIKVRTQ